MGYKFQFITLAGFHALNHSMFNLAHGYARTGMSAYVELQEAEFADEARGYTAIKHQAEVGTGYFDQVATALNPDLRHARAERLHRSRAVPLMSTTMTAEMTTARTMPRVHGVAHHGFHEILTTEALAFVGMLDQAIAVRRADLLCERGLQQLRRNAGQPLDFLSTTASVREDASWQVAEPPPGLEERRCEITGPPTRKMTVNALNSGASVWMADFEDATAPTWFNVIDGQRNLRLAFRGELDFTENGKHYTVGERQPTVMVRPRGWHLDERHLTLHGQPLSASVVDFGLFLFHNADWLISHGAGPYFYLPKLESHLEARLWNDVFVLAEELLGLAPGTIRATVLIETFPAAFEMEEILYELRDHSAGLNAGRWDYIFSYLKTYAEQGPAYVLPDRGQITMTTPMMRAYTRLLVDTCHRRGAQAIGGMSAFVPNRQDPAATEAALAEGCRGQVTRSGRRFRRLLGCPPWPGRDLPGCLWQDCGRAYRSALPSRSLPRI